MFERAAGWNAKAWVLVAATAAGCAAARADRARGPTATLEAVVAPAGETLVMLRDLAPGQPLVAFGRQSAHLTQDGLARLREAVVEEARQRGLDQVRAASAPAALAPVPPVPPARIEGATWGDNVAVSRGPAPVVPVRPAPPLGATWLEVTSLDLDQARLADGPGATALTLQVTAVRTSVPLAGRGRPHEAEVRFTLVDPAPLAALDAPPAGAAAGDADALRAATARLLARAAGRLASMLVPAAPPAASPGAGPRPIPGAGPGPEVPLEVTYVARAWVVAPAASLRARAAAGGALKGMKAGENLAYAGLLCGPLAPVCMGALALAGGGIGLVAGAAGGAAGAPATPPSGPMRARLPPEPERAALLEALRRQVAGLALVAAVERAAHGALQGLPEATPALAPPRLARVEVRLTGDDGTDDPARLALVLTVAPPPGPAGPDLLVLETPDALPARTWMDDDGALLRQVLERAAEAAGKALVARALEAPAPPAAPPTTPI